MRRFLPFILVTLLIGQTGCIPNKDAIKEHLTGSWGLTNHCHEYGFVRFSSDGSGTLSVNEECVIGYPCINNLPFNWSVDEKSGLLTVTYNNQSTAQLICSQGGQLFNSGIYPATETAIVSESTSIISLQGYTFDR